MTQGERGPQAEEVTGPNGSPLQGSVYARKYQHKIMLTCTTCSCSAGDVVSTVIHDVAAYYLLMLLIQYQWIVYQHSSVMIIN